MNGPKGPDVSPDLQWLPVVSFLQLVFDMAIALDVPIGHGHIYAFTDHIRPWIEVTRPEGWTNDGLARLQHVLRQREEE